MVCLFLENNLEWSFSNKQTLICATISLELPGTGTEKQNYGLALCKPVFPSPFPQFCPTLCLKLVL
jgi:hypothetical protein